MASIEGKKVTPTPTESGTKYGEIVAKLTKRFPKDEQVGFLDGVSKSKSPGELDSKLSSLYYVADEKDGYNLPKIIKKISTGILDKDFKKAFDGEVSIARAGIVGAIILPEPKPVPAKMKSVEFDGLTALSKSKMDDVTPAIDDFCMQNKSIHKAGMIEITEGGRSKSKTVEGFRIDRQNPISTGEYKDFVNFQIQNGGDSYAKVLIKPGIYSEGEIQTALKTGLTNASDGKGVVLHH